ncbi:hypothetical protein DENSPDRAFT_510161 [Dentipellis sp. KUC8613]|nr:hypothetical protein DENSPDRAFT_510161 [Dentipellis sp. KUC8613]
MTANSGEVDLDYKLPESIKGALEGWIGSCQNAAVASVLVASIVAQLMSPVGIIQDPDASKGSINPAALKALTVFSYTALLLSCGATLGALLLIDEFGQLPYRAAQQDNALRGGKIASSLYTFLDGFGLRSDCRLIRAYCAFFFCGSIEKEEIDAIVYRAAEPQRGSCLPDPAGHPVCVVDCSARSQDRSTSSHGVLPRTSRTPRPSPASSSSHQFPLQNHSSA